MKLEINHILIRTTDLDVMICFFEQVLELKNGKRPPFAFPAHGYVQMINLWFISVKQTPLIKDNWIIWVAKIRTAIQALELLITLLLVVKITTN